MKRLSTYLLAGIALLSHVQIFWIQLRKMPFLLQQPGKQKLMPRVL